jgi:hypothetical protein
MLRFAGILAVGVLLATPGFATPFAVPIDPSQSVLYFELCVAGNCATDSSAVTGSVTIDLDSIDSPAQIWLYDFDLYLSDNLHWYLSWGIFGSLTADATGVAIHYAYPGTPLGPTPIIAGNFAFVDVPVNSEGVVTYHATGVPCYALQGAGLPCDGSQNLADQGTQIADQFGGTVTAQNRIVTLMSQIDVTTPLDPNNPSLGTFHVYGTALGQVYVPIPVVPGDLNCDGSVDFGDINPFVLYLSNFAAWQAAYSNCPAANGDINGDGLYPDFGDINPFVALLTSQ